MSKSRKELIKGTVKDLVSSLLYYDRREDEDLPERAIEEAIEKNEITVQDIVDKFETELKKGLNL